MKHIILATITALASALPLAAAEKPNILIIYADDQSYETIRAFGHTDIDTPNPDRKKALFAKFRELQKRYDDNLDLEAVFPELK